MPSVKSQYGDVRRILASPVARNAHGSRLSIRRAMSLLELTVAAALLAALMTVSVQMIRALGSQQRSVERRALAIRTVQALVEQISNTPWEELTTESVERIEIPSMVTGHLPNPKLTIAVDDEQDPVAAKRVTVELQWSGPSGQPAGPARLTTWVFPDGLASR
jgi:type II secretory pathway pseudopilin PulG